jgi:hypothetical protein
MNTELIVLAAGHNSAQTHAMMMLLASSALMLRSAAAAATGGPLLSSDLVQIFANGTYLVAFPGAGGAPDASAFAPWLSSSPAMLYTNGNWSTPSVATTSGPTAGSDALGEFRRVDFAWSGVAWASSIRVYGSFLVFGQNYTAALEHGRAPTAGGLGAGMHGLGKDRPQSHWPAFSDPLPPSAPPLAYLGFSGCMSGRVETGPFPSPATPPPPKKGQPPATGPPWAGSNAGPLGLFDADGNTMVLSPLGPEVMSSIMNQAPPDVAVAAGLGGGVSSARHAADTNVQREQASQRARWRAPQVRAAEMHAGLDHQIGLLATLVDRALLLPLACMFCFCV